MRALVELRRFEGPSAAARPYGVEVEREWYLPALRCNACASVYSWGAIQHPDISLTGFPREAELRAPHGVGPAEYWPLHAQLQSWLGDSPELLPGMEFGRLGGVVRGRPPEFAWISIEGGVLLAGTTTRRLAEVPGVRWPRAVETDVRYGRNRGERIYWWDIPLWGRLSERVKKTRHTSPCAACGITPPDRVSRIALDRESVDGAPEIFRVSDRPSVVVASATVLEILADLRLFGLEGTPLEIL